MLNCADCNEPLKRLAFGGEPEEPAFGLQIREHARGCKSCRLMFIDEWFRFYNLKKGNVSTTPEQILKMTFEQILERIVVIQNVGDYRAVKID
jgi:hypothetical protein